MNIHVTDMQQFTQCRQRWMFSSRHGLSLTPNLPPQPMFLGSLFHRAVEVWHKCKDVGLNDNEAVAAAYTTIEEYSTEVFAHPRFQYSAPHYPTDHYGDAVELCTTMFENFNMWAPGRWEALPDQIERRIEVRIPTPKGTASYGVMVGKPDAIVKHRDRLWILELKTAKRRYGKSTMLDIDLQMGAYLWMVRKLGINVEGILRVTAFKTTPRAPQLKQNGEISRRKVTTTYELLLQTIIDNELDPVDYQDWLSQLKGAEHPCFQIQMFKRTQTELDIIESLLYSVYREMRKPRIFPSAALQCTYCSFDTLCRAKQQGTDYQYIIEEDFYEHVRS